MRNFYKAIKVGKDRLFLMMHTTGFMKESPFLCVLKIGNYCNAACLLSWRLVRLQTVS